MKVKMKRGDKVRVGDIFIELTAQGESAASVSISAPKEVPIIIERGIASPFQFPPRSDM